MGHFSDKFRIKVLNDHSVFLSIAHNNDFVEEYQIDTEEWITMFSLCSQGVNYKTDSLSVKYKGRQVHVFFRVSPGFRKGFACSDSEFSFLGSRLSASLHGLNSIEKRSTTDLTESTLPQTNAEDPILTFSTQFFTVIEGMSTSIMTKIEELNEKIANIDVSPYSEPQIQQISQPFSIFEEDGEIYIPGVLGDGMTGNVTTSQVESTDTADDAVAALKELRRSKK